MVLLDTGTHGTSREIFSEDADDGTRTPIRRLLGLGSSESMLVWGGVFPLDYSFVCKPKVMKFRTQFKKFVRLL